MNAVFWCRHCGAPITHRDTARVILCNACGTPQAAPVATYAIRCRDCRYGRSYGAAQLEARRAAGRHQRRRPTHRLYLLRGGLVVERFNPLPQLSFDDVPPF